MKLQISFDLTNLDKALEIAASVAPYASILEVGSLLIYKHGALAVSRFKEQFPTKDILADSKIIDRGKEAVSVFADAGADWVTVMAGTSKEVIHAVCTRAHELNKKVMIDLLDASSLGQAALEAKSLGGDVLVFHEAYTEAQALVFMEKWEMVRGNSSLPIFVSGRITRDIVSKIENLNPAGVIIGKAITEAANPAQEAQFFYEKFVENRS